MSAPALVGCAAAVLTLALPVAAASGALAAVQRAEGVADAAALGAADAASGWIEEEPCDLARRVADEADVTLVECVLDPATGAVRVRVSVRTMLGTAYARARAGPPVA